MRLALALVGPLAYAGPHEPPSEEPSAIEEVLAEVRALRAEMEAERAENAALREALSKRAPGVRPVAEPSERVSFGSPSVVRADEVVSEVVAFGADVRVEGIVRGDATSFGGDVWVLDGARVEGDALSFGGVVRVSPGARVDGDRVGLATRGQERGGEPGLLSAIYHRIVLLMSFAGAGILVIGLFPDRVARIARGIEAAPVRSGFVGAAVSASIALFSLLFALVTLGLGTPVSLMMLAVLGAAWLFGFVGLCQVIGDRLPFADKAHGRWLTFLIGTLLLSCLGSLPWIGWLVVTGGSLLGIGAAIRSRFGDR